MTDLNLLLLAMSVIATIVFGFLAMKNGKRANELANRANELQEANNVLQEREKHLRWTDIEFYVDELVKQMKNDNFMPDYLIAIIGQDAILASLIFKTLSNPNISILVGRNIRENEGFKVAKEVPGYKFAISETTNGGGYYFYQEALPVKKTDKVLLIRDHTVTGNAFDIMRKVLTGDYKIPSENIKTLCISYDENGRRLPPDYSVRKDSDIWFPWGRKYT